MSTDSVNPNTPVTEVATSSSGNGKVEIDSGGGPLTFDELDQVLGSKKAKKQSEPKDEKPKDEKSKDLTSDTDKGKKSEAKKSDDKKESQDSKESEKPEASEKPAARKTVKAKYADSDIELDEETLIPVPVNGEIEMWTLKDLRADKSGKTAWDKKFTELSKKEKIALSKEIKLQESSEKIKALFDEQDPDMKMYRLAQFAGVDPVQYRAKFLNDNISLLEKYYNMSEDERKADALAYEAKFHKHRADTLESSTKQEQAQRELSAKVNQLRASHQISEDEFSTRYQQLAEAANGGKLGDTQITPEFIVETIQKDRLWNSAASKLDTLELGLDEQSRNARLMKLVENAHQMGLSAEEMPEMVDQIWGSTRVQKKIEDKKKQAEEFTHGKRDASQVRAAKPEALFFDDI